VVCFHSPSLFSAEFTFTHLIHHLFLYLTPSTPLLLSQLFPITSLSALTGRQASSPVPRAFTFNKCPHFFDNLLKCFSCFRFSGLVDIQPSILSFPLKSSGVRMSRKARKISSTFITSAVPSTSSSSPSLQSLLPSSLSLTCVSNPHQTWLLALLLHIHAPKHLQKPPSRNQCEL
jgi:hypothetical protein